MLVSCSFSDSIYVITYFRDRRLVGVVFRGNNCSVVVCALLVNCLSVVYLCNVFFSVVIVF